MRISDWSSDVCSSDLDLERDRVAGLGAGGLAQALVDLQPVAALAVRLQRRLERLAFERAVDSDHAARGQLRAGACRQDQECPCGALRARRAQQLRLEADRSEEHTSELQSLMRISYAVFCLKKKKNTTDNSNTTSNFTLQDIEVYI